jgi:hypothetical protein
MKTSSFILRIPAFVVPLIISLFFSTAIYGQGSFYLTVNGDKLLLNGKEFKIKGLRCSNSLRADNETNNLINYLDTFKIYGINTVSVYLMGSRFGDIKGYNPDASLNMTYINRLGKIIEAADKRGMVVLVGCLYWGNSTAKADLKHWTQNEANTAVSNTVRWLKDKNYTNIFVDPDNEGMAHAEMNFDISKMIDSGHQANPECILAYNEKSPSPPNSNINIHFGPKVKGKPYVETEGTPSNSEYWGKYSKVEGYYNYINVGIYTDTMKIRQKEESSKLINEWNGYVFASTWLQCVPDKGPNMSPGGYGTKDDPGIRWWLGYIRENYGGAYIPDRR